MPAYAASGFKVRGIYDPNLDKAHELVEQHGFAVYISVQQAAGQKNTIFDLATPPAAHKDILGILPKGAEVLIQKPMGSDLANATQIMDICRIRSLKAAVNFQLRFSPMMLALRDAIDTDLLGEVVDFDAWMALDTPWSLWGFLDGLPRVEILMHSIHYFDFIRSILGNPKGVHAKTMGYPNRATSNTRTAAILDYGDSVRCALLPIGDNL